MKQNLGKVTIVNQFHLENDFLYLNSEAKQKFTKSCEEDRKKLKKMKDAKIVNQLQDIMNGQQQKELIQLIQQDNMSEIPMIQQNNSVADESFFNQQVKKIILFKFKERKNIFEMKLNTIKFQLNCCQRSITYFRKKKQKQFIQTQSNQSPLCPKCKQPVIAYITQFKIKDMSINIGHVNRQLANIKQLQFICACKKCIREYRQWQKVSYSIWNPITQILCQNCKQALQFHLNIQYTIQQIFI